MTPFLRAWLSRAPFATARPFSPAALPGGVCPRRSAGGTSLSCADPKLTRLAPGAPRRGQNLGVPPRARSCPRLSASGLLPRRRIPALPLGAGHAGFTGKSPNRRVAACAVQCVCSSVTTRYSSYSAVVHVQVVVLGACAGSGRPGEVIVCSARTARTRKVASSTAEPPTTALRSAVAGPAQPAGAASPRRRQ